MSTRSHAPVYSLSPATRVIAGSSSGLLYHAVLGTPRVVDAAILDLIAYLTEPRTLNELTERYSGEVEDVLDGLVMTGLIRGPQLQPGTVPVTLVRTSRRKFLDGVAAGQYLSRLELAISDACNLGCPHCMHFVNNAESLEAQSKLKMDFGSAKRSVDAFVAVVRSHGKSSVRVHFGNGEPLTNFGTLNQVLEYCESISDISFSYAMNTNLTLLTERMAIVLKRFGVKLATSLDGAREANNLIRIDRKGRGTFDRILEKFELLRRVGHPVEGFTVTVTDSNFDLVGTDVIDIAIKYGISDVSMDFDLVNPNRFSPDACVNKAMAMRRYARANGVSFYGTWETPFRNLLTASWSNGPHAFCPAMQGETLEFGVDGDIRTCGHTSTKVGSNFDPGTAFGPEGRFAALIGSRLPGNDPACRGCMIEGPCAGQCQVTREAAKRNAEVFHFNCELLRGATEALVRDYLADTAFHGHEMAEVGNSTTATET